MSEQLTLFSHQPMVEHTNVVIPTTNAPWPSEPAWVPTPWHPPATPTLPTLTLRAPDSGADSLTAETTPDTVDLDLIARLILAVSAALRQNGRELP